MSQQIVPMDSATFGSHTAIGIHANHSDMTKYSSDDSNGYIRVTAELTRWLKKFEEEKKTTDENLTGDKTIGKDTPGMVTNGGVNHHGKNEKGSIVFSGSTFGGGTHIVELGYK